MKLFIIFRVYNSDREISLAVANTLEEATEKVKARHPDALNLYGEEAHINGYTITVTPNRENENSLISDPFQYIDNFDDAIYDTLITIAKTKGIEIDNDLVTNEMISEIRTHIISYLMNVTDYTVDLTPPKKQYQVGDSVQLKSGLGKIIFIPSMNLYGILFPNHEVKYSTFDNVDDLTEYLKDTGLLND